MAQWKCTTCGFVETLDHFEPECCSVCCSGVFDLTRALAIAAKNDAFRRSIVTGETKSVPQGRVVATRAVVAEGEIFVRLAMEAVARQTTFTEDEDPRSEHGFGKVDVTGKPLFWVIDLYDTAYEFGADDPLDDTTTRRVLTIHFPSDY